MAGLLHHLDQHTQELVRGASVAFILKVLAAGLAFGLNVILSRMLGAKGSGIFYLAFTIVMLGSAIGRVGMENALVKFIAANISAGKPDMVLVIHRKAIIFSIVTSTILSTLLYNFSPWLADFAFSKHELIQPLTIMSLAIVPLSLLTLYAYSFQGLMKIAISVTMMSIASPLLTCLGVMIFVPTYGINAAAISYLCATTLTFITGWILWRWETERFTKKKPDFSNRELLTTSIPLMWVVLLGITINWAPLIFLGRWESYSNVGIYSAASRTAMLTSFILIAVNSIAAPKFAASYQQGNFAVLEILVKNSSRIMILLATPILVLFISMPEFILGLFGDEFRRGATVLTILSIGQFINVATGSVGYLLLMSGNEVSMRNNLLLCSLIGLVLNCVLIPTYGIVGAAVSVSLVIAIQNFTSTFIVWKRLGILSLPWSTRPQTISK